MKILYFAMFAGLCAAAMPAQAQTQHFSNNSTPGLGMQNLGPAGHGGLSVGRRGGTGGLNVGRVGGTGGLQGYNTTKSDDIGTPDAPNVYVPPYKQRVR
jgi:hypothetical protein